MMEKAIIGKKIGMTQIFDEAGRVVPVTLIQAGPCTVLQKKTAEKDGYNAIQLGYQEVPERKLTKPEIGHQKKAGVEELKKVLKEFPLEDCSKFEVGDMVRHISFGLGTVLSVRPMGADTLYEIAFESVGTKKLMATYAKLTKG